MVTTANWNASYDFQILLLRQPVFRLKICLKAKAWSLSFLGNCKRQPWELLLLLQFQVLGPVYPGTESLASSDSVLRH